MLLVVTVTMTWMESQFSRSLLMTESLPTPEGPDINTIKGFTRLTCLSYALRFSLLVDSIKYITTPEGVTVTDRKQIIDFCDNTPSVILGEIQDKLTTLRTQAQVPAIKMKSTEEQIKAGAPVNYEIPITFDNSNFFG